MSWQTMLTQKLLLKTHCHPAVAWFQRWQIKAAGLQYMSVALFIEIEQYNKDMRMLVRASHQIMITFYLRTSVNMRKASECTSIYICNYQSNKDEEKKKISKS